MDSLIVDLGIPVALLVLAYVTGTVLESRHYTRIRRREGDMRDILVFASKNLPTDRSFGEPRMVMGSVVISSDYFKSMLAALRGIIGGKIHSLETLLDRARREAILRMKDEAAVGGADMVFNVKFETTRISAGFKNTAVTVEVIAFGTAVKAGERPA